MSGRLHPNSFSQRLEVWVQDMGYNSTSFPLSTLPTNMSAEDLEPLCKSNVQSIWEFILTRIKTKRYTIITIIISLIGNASSLLIYVLLHTIF